MGKLPMESRNTVVKPVRNKVESIRLLMLIPRTGGKRSFERIKNAAVYEEESEHLVCHEPQFLHG
jgi:hypothetical protein